MSTESLYNVYLASLVFALVAGLYSFGILHKAIRLIFFMIAMTVVTETTTKILELKHLVKSPIYHFYSIISLFIIFVYFIRTVKTRNATLYIAIGAVVLPLFGIVNCVFFQPLYRLNSNVLMFKGFAIIAMSLFALYRLMLNDKYILIYRHPDFWAWVLFLLLNSGTFFFWSFILIFSKDSKYLETVTYIQETINIVVYTGFGFVFLLHPRKLIE